jgi:hypothetical protein
MSDVKNTKITLCGYLDNDDWLIADIESDFTTEHEIEGIKLSIHKSQGKVTLEFEPTDPARGDVVMVPEGRNQLSFRHAY